MIFLVQENSNHFTWAEFLHEDWDIYPLHPDKQVIVPETLLVRKEQFSSHVCFKCLQNISGTINWFTS